MFLQVTNIVHCFVSLKKKIIKLKKNQQHGLYYEKSMKKKRLGGPRLAHGP